MLCAQFPTKPDLSLHGAAGLSQPVHWFILGDEVVPMKEAELRTRIRELLQSGVLPRMFPPMTMLEPGLPAAARDRIQAGRVSGTTCTACEEPNPYLTYRYPAGRVVHLHTRCNVIWNEERRRA
jgi:hypothetical protein